MATSTTTEFVRSASRPDAAPFSLIEQQRLISRLLQELEGALGELARDPSSFIRDLFSGDAKDGKRRQRIYIGLACAVVAHVALIVLIAVLGWRTIFVKHAEAAHDGNYIFVPLARTPDRAPTQGDVPLGEKDAGSGGGGDHNPLPATAGPLPQMSSNPQIVKPNAPHTPLPTVQIPPTIVGPDSPPPVSGLALGVPTGAISDVPSPGPGEKEGLGGPSGTGAGPGSGPSSGPGGRGGGPGGKDRIGLPTGRDDVKGPIPYNLIRNFPDSTGIVWLYRSRPIVTPEARANKVIGEVWLRATFREDGTITDIEVIREVPFMTESAIQALERSRFRPATIKGRPVTLTSVPVRINVNVFER